MDNREKLKIFLQQKIQECKVIIRKRKRKNKIVKGIYISLITISMISGTIVTIFASVSISPLTIACVSGLSTLLSALSVQFNLQNKKTKLYKNIQDLNKIKDKLDYVISCNGNLSNEDCKRILDEFRDI